MNISENTKIKRKIAEKIKWVYLQKYLYLHQFLIGHFSNSLFLTNAYKIEINFCLHMCILMGKRLAVFLNSFLLLQSFWGKNVKIDFF